MTRAGDSMWIRERSVGTPLSGVAVMAVDVCALSVPHDVPGELRCACIVTAEATVITGVDSPLVPSF